MIIWIRNIVIIFVLLTAAYLALSTVSRIRQRQKLKLNYKDKNIAEPQDEYMTKGMAKYERSLKPKLFVLVYVFPLAVLLLLGYLAQYS